MNMCLCAYMYIYTTMHVWKPEDNLKDLVLSFQYVGSFWAFNSCPEAYNLPTNTSLYIFEKNYSL